MRRYRARNLYYITHVNNVPSILNRGILSHRIVISQKIPYTPVYDANIVANRNQIKVTHDKSLWDFANLYFQPRNPMLYRVLCEKDSKDIAIVAVRPDILNQSNIFISDGNAASHLTKIFPREEGLKLIRQIKKDVEMVYWTDVDSSKRKIMAECLVPDSVPSEYIQSIYVADHDVASLIRPTIPENIPVIPEPHFFFKPVNEIVLTQSLIIAEGDMFFSGMQTLTVSVNCVGVMGKGLASRAKYQFPDVYVKYQDLCRGRILRMGKPYLHKREVSFEQQLADEPYSLPNGNNETWFLLFPTKRHWKYKADFVGIEEGLQWLVGNYKKESIRSIALPALGCGLGRLQWSDIGPLMCKYLHNLEIPVRIYLPAERKALESELTKEFLLSLT